eukprot:TRINITY_DN6030_c0_g1_i3.p1 TRINITY_DN6030_c0_g1~~TRINITY_DN6030_c0_g1_i3.p1  ORF type:complete len:397 (-),score=56.08 TRINITY_DN6030_c0_g1_i3:16-1206(-)
MLAGTTLDILDTGGLEEFSSMRDLYFRSGEGFVLVYSVTDRKSFECLETAYLDRILKVRESAAFGMVLCATKCDLKGKRVVSTEEGCLLAKRFGIPFVETSAKENLNISACFELLVKDMKKVKSGRKSLGAVAGELGQKNIDKRGIARSSCTKRFCGCTQYECEGPTHKCGYCGHAPTKHISLGLYADTQVLVASAAPSSPSPSPSPPPSQAQTEPERPVFRLAVVGDGGVGKTSFCIRFRVRYTADVRRLKDKLERNEFPTEDTICKTITIDGKQVSVQLRDSVPDYHRVTSLACTAYRGLSAILFIYDITNSETFMNAKQWIMEAQRYAPAGTKFIAIGNKTDLGQQRVVPSDMLSEFSEADLRFELSVKTGENVDTCVDKVLRLLLATVNENT